MDRMLALSLWIMCVLSVAVGVPALADTFELTAPVESDMLQFRDELVQVQFALGREDGQYRRIAFTLVNLSQKAITIDWITSSITLPSGEASNIIHEGTRYLNANSYIAPTTVPSGSRVSDSAIPTSSLEYTYGQRAGWRVHAMKMDEGAEFGLYLSLIVEGETRGYDFRFRAVGVINAKPVARFSVNGESDLYLEYTSGWVVHAAAPRVDFDGRASADPDGTILSYSWDFGDGATGSGVSVTHTYDSLGSYDVQLLVADDKGGTASVTRTVAWTSREVASAALRTLVFVGLSLGLVLFLVWASPTLNP